jgi:sugar-specific transcriptional regulator TrmB
MDRIEDILLRAGLTKGECRVYLALLGLGESTVTSIAKSANVSLSKVYEILGNLIKKGLVGSISKNNVRHFSAADPERIADYLESKKQEIVKSEDEIKKALPLLKSKKGQTKPKEIAVLYEGYKGIQTFYETMLRDLGKDDIVYALGIPRYIAERYEGYFLDWNKRRANKGISIKVLYEYDALEPANKRAKIPKTEIRFLSKEFKAPAWIIITKNAVATIHLAEEPICIIVKDKNVIQSNLQFFNLLWNSASEIK